MKNAADRLIEARRAERAARTHWFGALDTAQARFAPNAIAKDALDQFKDSANEAAEAVTDAVRKRPGAIVAVGAAVGLFLFRKPIASAFRSRMARRKETKRRRQPLVKQKQSGTGPIADPTPKTTLTEEV